MTAVTNPSCIYAPPTDPSLRETGERSPDDLTYEDAQAERAWERQVFAEQWAECQRMRRLQYENAPDGPEWEEMEHPQL